MDAVTITQITPPELEILIENSIRKVLVTQSKEPQPEPDRWFDINELCNYLPDKPARATVYGYVHFGKIPFHKGQKKLRFLKSEIDAWLSLGRIKTVDEIQAEVDNYLMRKG